MSITADLKETQKAKIREALPSWLQPLHCTISPTPSTGKYVNYWCTTYKCPGCQNKHQPKAYWKEGTSTQATVAKEMAQKIDDKHGRCNVTAPTKTPASGSKADEITAIMESQEKRNRDLETQVTVTVPVIHCHDADSAVPCSCRQQLNVSDKLTLRSRY